ncbi:hypothetical protein BC938DRAFT_474229 [Jimgerdemannia flammicorona]|uniref:Centromere protein X n=1 Tax=Jimgerdemannia flammicorona TaxID=994334 RepID=A0A433Q2J2_9FUNG|nr:hypothetical protein BC938DRAFT_474229 [Jimgerdemannia flammicorona]
MWKESGTKGPCEGVGWGAVRCGWGKGGWGVWTRPARVVQVAPVVIEGSRHRGGSLSDPTDRTILYLTHRTLYNRPANKDSLQLSAEFIRLFTIEAIHRAADAAQSDPSSSGRTLEAEHLEKVVAQLLLDF